MNNIVPLEYQGQPVQFSTGGWINATDVAKQFGKLPGEWMRLPETKRYMEALASALNEGESRNLIRSSRGRGGGTWLHPKLAVTFARWLDIDFAVWCDLRIDGLMRGDLNAREQFEQACSQLDDRRGLASEQGKGLAAWRWQKAPLEQRVEYWREKLQMSLPLYH